MPAAGFAAGKCEPSGKGFSDPIKLTGQMPSTVVERELCAYSLLTPAGTKAADERKDP